MTQYKRVNIIPKLDVKVFQTSSSDIHNNEWSEDTSNAMLRHWLSYLNILTPVMSLVKLFKHFDPSSNNNRNIINLSSYMILEKEINLINNGLPFVPSLP